MYQLKGSSRIYSDLYFPIKNVNPKRIVRRFKVKKVEDYLNDGTSESEKVTSKKIARRPQDEKTGGEFARKSVDGGSKKCQKPKRVQPKKFIHKKKNMKESSSEESGGMF